MGKSAIFKPSLFGLKHLNRDFSQKETWGKNQFNSSFPASLCAYLDGKGLKNVYLKLDENLKVQPAELSTQELYGLAPDSDNLFYAFESQFRGGSKMITIDLFAGCGGLSLGFQKAGFTIVAAFDNWIPAIDVYRNNFSHPIFNVDLSRESSQEIFAQYNPEIIVGSPPCQDFSSAGKRDEGLGRANLTLTFAEIVTGVSPQWFVMENVDRIEKSKILTQAKQIFKSHGYGLTEKVINSCYCGVPQTRKRYFLIGKMKEEDDFLIDEINENLSSQPLTVFDYMGKELDIEYYYRHPRSYQRRAIFSIYEPSPTIRGVNRPVPKTYRQHPGDACHLKEKLRPLTTRERSYIQTFPKDFIFTGTKSNLEQMIGNAVPVNLSRYVGQCILNYELKKGNKTTYRQLQLFS